MGTPWNKDSNLYCDSWSLTEYIRLELQEQPSKMEEKHVPPEGKQWKIVPKLQEPLINNEC